MMGKIGMRCSGCGAMLRVDGGLVGKSIRCPKCGTEVLLRLAARTAEGPLAPAQEAGAQSLPVEEDPEPAPERIPCPACAELILPDASVCRFCGHVIKSLQGPAARRLNIPAVVSLALAIFAWPVVGICFFFWFRQLIQSMLVGVAVSAAAVGCGIWGVAFSVRNRAAGARGLMLSLTGMILGTFGVTSFLLYVTLAKKASDALPQSMPVVKGLLGTATMLTMQCAECGYQFEVAATDVLARMAGDTVQMLAGARDINKVLDEYEERGPLGMTCPNCKKQKAFPMCVCPECGKKFLPDFYKKSGRTPTKIVCPYCGARVPFEPTGLLEIGGEPQR